MDFVQNCTISRQKLAVAEILVFDRQNRRNCRTKLKDINGNNRVIVKNLKLPSRLFSLQEIYFLLVSDVKSQIVQSMFVLKCRSSETHEMGSSEMSSSEMSSSETRENRQCSILP